MSFTVDSKFEGLPVTTSRASFLLFINRFHYVIIYSEPNKGRKNKFHGHRLITFVVLKPAGEETIAARAGMLYAINSKKLVQEWVLSVLADFGAMQYLVVDKNADNTLLSKIVRKEMQGGGHVKNEYLNFCLVQHSVVKLQSNSAVEN